MRHMGVKKNITTIPLPYGKDTITFTPPVECSVYLPNPIVTSDPWQEISRSLDHPIRSVSMQDFLGSTDNLTILVNDGTRPTITPLVIAHLLHLLGAQREFRFLIATGTHSGPDEPALRRIFGDHLGQCRDRIVVHDARDYGGLEYLGTTSRGTEVHVNRHILDSDGIICIGNVKPHYFAGFAGGRKSLIPGVAGFRTIEQNHAHACDPRALPMRLAGNPVAEDLEEGVRMLKGKRIFSIQSVLDPDHRLVGCFSGDLHESFRASVDRAKEIFGVPVPFRASIVITANLYPMDIDLYQSQHALENVREVVEPGGIVILVSRCWNGAGNTTYLDALDAMTDVTKAGSGGGVEDKEITSGTKVECPTVPSGYRLGDHKAIRFRQMAEHADLWMVTDLDEHTVRRSLMTHVHTIQEAVDMAVTRVEERGMIPKIRVFPMGGMTVPWPQLYKTL